ncbi:MAG TPA: DUF6325 family protein [Anaerolineales bacterium]|nr:DUF6325 family protein [Anaerolineales bacterium]
MTVGPVQVVIVGFNQVDQFRGEVLQELSELRGRGLIRLIDLFVAVKSPTGEVTAKEMSGLTREESVEFGKVISKLLGLSEMEGSEASAEAIERMMAAASHSIGLDFQGIRKVVDALPPGKAFGVLMFEHTWAIPLRDAVRRAGGFPLAQGFITAEALMMVGEELKAIAEAERTIEVSQIVKNAAILDTLATIEEAEAIKTAIAADVVRTLVVAELIEEAAIEEAIETLEAARLLEAKYLETAKEAEAKAAAETNAIFSASE